MRLIISIFTFFILLSSASDFGLGISSGYGTDSQTTFDSSYTMDVVAIPFSLDFYGDISYTKTDTEMKKLLNALLEPLSYKFSYKADKIISTATSLPANTFNTESIDIMHTVSFTLLYDLYENNGYFFDAGIGISYLLGFQNLASRSDTASTIDISGQDGDIKIWPLWEFGIGKTWSKFSLRVTLSRGHVTSIALSALDNIDYIYPRLVKTSVIYWW